MEKTVIDIRINQPVIALVGNPIYADIALQNEETGEKLGNQLIHFELLEGDKLLYSGVAVTDLTGMASIQFSELLQQICSKPEFIHGEVFTERPDLRRDYTLTVRLENGEASYSATVIYGCIPNRMLRYLRQRNSNIFTYKFLNKRANFLGITRSGGKEIQIFESELLPVMGIGTGDKLVITGEKGSVSYESHYLRPYQINLPEICALCGPKMSFRLGGEESVSINVVSNPESLSCQLFEYRNTFGHFERFLATGNTTLQADADSQNTSGVYDKECDLFVPIEQYPEYELTRTIPTGYLSADRINALRAILASEEVYLIKDNTRERVLVSSSDKIPEMILEPFNMNLTVKSCSSDTGYIPDLNSDDYSDPRLHDEYFNKNYN